MTLPMKITLNFLAPLFFLQIAAAANEVRFFSWDEPVPDVLIQGGPKEAISIANGELTREITFSPAENSLELFRMDPKPGEKNGRMILGRCALPAANRLIAILVSQQDKDVPFQILPFPDPPVSDSNKTSAVFFNFSLVPLTIQVGAYGESTDQLQWPTPPRTLLPQQADVWDVPVHGNRLPVTVALPDKQGGQKKLFSRNLLLMPGHRTLVFFREEPQPGIPIRPGEGVLYTIIHDPIIRPSP